MQVYDMPKSRAVKKMWWLKQFALVLLASFYLYVGICLLISAYRLEEPFPFILTFFASNFVILISAALLFGFVFRIITALRTPRAADPAVDENEEGNRESELK